MPNIYTDFGRFRRFADLLLVLCLVGGQILIPELSVALEVPAVDAGKLSVFFSSPILSGIRLNPDSPLKIDFIIDPGDDGLKNETLQEDSKKLINYFMATLTVPKDQMWVNLSFYEDNRIIPDSLGRTQMGRDMLEQDYMLKELTASLVNPQHPLGKEFWKKVYDNLQEKFGRTDIPVETFNKVWILPQEPRVYVDRNTVFVTNNYLKVMLDQDYSAQNKSNLGYDIAAKRQGSAVGLMREIILPEIEREINTGKNFANLRQIYNSMILAVWYKNKLKNTALSRIYSDQNKTLGIELADKTFKDEIYRQYVAAYKGGAFNYVREEVDSATGELVPRKYFSGGLTVVDKVGEGPLPDDWQSRQKGKRNMVVRMDGRIIGQTETGQASSAIYQVAKPLENVKSYDDPVSGKVRSFVGLNDYKILALDISYPRGIYIDFDSAEKIFKGDQGELRKVISDIKTFISVLDKKGKKEDRRLISIRSAPYISMPGRLSTVLEVDSTNEREVKKALLKVIYSWNNPSAQSYRRDYGIAEDFRMQILIQEMAYNDKNFFGSGVIFSRDPNTGENKPLDVFARGEKGFKVVSGTADVKTLSSFREAHPHSQVDDRLLRWIKSEEERRGYPIEVEYSIFLGEPSASISNIVILQVKPISFAPQAEIDYLMSLIKSGTRTMPQIIDRLDKLQKRMGQRKIYRVKESFKGVALDKGLTTTRGAILGRAVFNPQEASRWADRGNAVIFISHPRNREKVIDRINRYPQAGLITVGLGNDGDHELQITRSAGIAAVINVSTLKLKNDRLVSQDGYEIQEGDWLLVDADHNAIFVTQDQTVLEENTVVSDMTFGVDIPAYKKQFVAQFTDAQGRIKEEMTLDHLRTMNIQKIKEWKGFAEESKQAFLATIEKHVLHNLISLKAREQNKRLLWDSVAFDFIIEDARTPILKELATGMAHDMAGPSDEKLESDPNAIYMLTNIGYRLEMGDLDLLLDIVEKDDAYSPRIGALAKAKQVQHARTLGYLKEYAIRARGRGWGPDRWDQGFRKAYEAIYNTVKEEYAKVLSELLANENNSPDLNRKQIALAFRLYNIGAHLTKSNEEIDFDVAKSLGNTLKAYGLPQVFYTPVSENRIRIRFPLFSQEVYLEDYRGYYPQWDQWTEYLEKLQSIMGQDVKGKVESAGRDGDGQHKQDVILYNYAWVEIPKDRLQALAKYISENPMPTDASSALLAGQENFGGIDMNNLDVKEDGFANSFNFSLEDLQNIDPKKVAGILPVITAIVPADKLDLMAK